jgi:hypothetical protein
MAQEPPPPLSLFFRFTLVQECMVEVPSPCSKAWGVEKIAPDGSTKNKNQARAYPPLIQIQQCESGMMSFSDLDSENFPGGVLPLRQDSYPPWHPGNKVAKLPKLQIRLKG